ncbi:MAG: glycoside hydrolase family 9 protein [Ruminococcus sp.]|nr:glycoside hydrolase family 9 protein [Ruminococcus sp.]
MLKKFISGAMSAVMLAASVGSTVTPTVTAADTPNYAEALQKSLFFYECQQAGPLPEWNRVEWRADSTMIDEIKGGWYDAGDHVKFNLPMAYTASVLAWGLYQYPDGVESCGEMTNYVNNLEFVLDYFADCDLGDEVVFQVGNGTIDHTWWGPVEVYQYGMEDAGTSYAEARQTYKASKGCSAVFGGMAAALAAGYCALEGRIDSGKLAGYLEHAENIFKIASTSPGNDTYNDSNASGFYRSSHFYDELFYAANWLYIATGDKAYLDKAASYIPNLDKELGQDVLKYTWCMCWDDVMQGAMLLYAINTKEDTYINHVKKHIDYLTYDSKKVEGKMAYIDSWGCARYAQAAAFMTAVASDTVLADTDTSDYVQFYEDQINFVLGDNSDGQSYVVGYGDKPAHNAHHRTAHGSWKNDIYMPEQNRHILYGALVGGPNQDGSYEDDRNNYINNEVATDYNAGFTAILCKMIDKYGGKSDPSFPQPEKRDGPEFFVECLTKGGDSSGATISFKITNHSAWPARLQDNISFRYYMDLSEVKAAGHNPENLVIRCDRDQSAMYASSGVKPAEISKPVQYDGDIYYIEVNLPDGRAVMPVSEGMQQCEILLALVMPDYASGWDSSNDPSFKELANAKGTTDAAGTVKGIVTKYVPVYINGELYYGEEPDGTSADGNASPEPDKPAVTTTTAPKPVTTTTTVTTKPTTTTPDVTDDITPSNPGGNTDIIYGDANCDGKVTIADSTAILQSIGNPDKYGLSEQGTVNGDVDGNKGITAADAITIKQYDAKLISSLPLNE